MSNNQPVGVFDSGVGGLTVAREIMRQMPDERIVYFGDTARVPYGTKSQGTVLRFVRQIVSFLETHDVKAIVVACNTASAYALETIEREIDLPIIGVIKPGTELFRAFEQKVGRTPDQLWMIGDSFESDIAGAKKAGWHAVLLNLKGEMPPEDPALQPDLAGECVIKCESD